jgi:Tfp pilus assembly protein PilX
MTQNRFLGRRALRQREGGAVLLVGLVMLVVITLLSLVAMQNTRQQTRMAGNASLFSQLFQKAETGLRGVENLLYARDDAVTTKCPGFYRLIGVAGASPVDSAPDTGDSAGWAQKCEINLEAAYGAGSLNPWYVIEQLPNVTSDASARVQNRRDMEVFRVSVLSSDADPVETDDSNVVVILQSIIMRH